MSTDNILNVKITLPDARGASLLRRRAEADQHQLPADIVGIGWKRPVIKCACDGPDGGGFRRFRRRFLAIRRGRDRPLFERRRRRSPRRWVRRRHATAAIYRGAQWDDL